MPTSKNALNLLFILLLSSGLLTAAAPVTSLAENSFNSSLRSGGGEGTTAPRNGLAKVVIDAGHGGKDPGGMGKNSREKDITLRIARLLAIGIRTNYPDVEVVLTRSDDTFVPLYERAAIANRAGADLFISIHANIMPGSSATYGTETFVMGQHVAEQNLRVAKRENAAILLESGDVTANYGYDPNSPEGHILMSLQQHAFLEQSILFARGVEEEFARAGRKSRGVKQAGFVVLKATTMPAVLVETGFMSNAAEEAFLLSDAGQQQLASALLMAFKRYHQSVTGRPSAYNDRPRNAPAPPRQPDNETEHTEHHRRPPSAGAGEPASGRPTGIFAKEVVPDNNRARRWTARAAGALPPSAPIDVRTVVEVDSLSPNNYRFSEARQRKVPLNPGRVDLRTVPDNQLTYAVQVFATARDLDLTQQPWRAVPYPIVKVREGQLNKYQVRNLPTARAAAAARRRVKAAGISEVMVVVYLNGKRLPPPAVTYLMNR